MPALFTPFDAQGRLNEDMVRRMVEVFVRAGMHGLYVCGGSGEGLLLTTAERKRMAEIVVREARGRVAVILHVGSVSTQEAAELAAHGEKVGADAVAAVPPFFYGGGTPDAVHGHYSGIASRCKLPLLVYNLPGLVHYEVTPAMMSRLLDIKTVAGIKFSSAQLFSMWRMLQLDPERLTVLSGNDEIFAGALAMGAHGSIGLTLNLMPRLFLEIYSSFQAGDMECARRSQNEANEFISLLLEYPSVPAAKYMMRLLGYDCGPCRGPLVNLTEAQQASFRAAADRIGFLERQHGLQP